MSRPHAVARRVMQLSSLILLLVATACGSKSAAGGGNKHAPAPAGGTSDMSGGTSVTVENFSFEPKSLDVKTGTKVTWTFKDSAPHNVKANDGSFKSQNLSSGKSYSFTFNTAGTYKYICTIHQYMTGTVNVR